MISASLDAWLRPSRTSQPKTRIMMRYSRRTDTNRDLAATHTTGQTAAHRACIEFWSGTGPAEWLTGPWTVVKAYYHDITVRDYAAAWWLLGHRPHGAAYATFVAGYAHTGRQIVRKLSQSGDQVSFTLRSENPDGTVQTYRVTD